MTFIMIVREFTAVNLAEAKDLLDRVRRGESVDLCPYEPGRAAAFAEKLLLNSAIDRAKSSTPNEALQRTRAGPLIFRVRRRRNSNDCE